MKVQNNASSRKKNLSCLRSITLGLFPKIGYIKKLFGQCLSACTWIVCKISRSLFVALRHFTTPAIDNILLALNRNEICTIFMHVYVFYNIVNETRFFRTQTTNSFQNYFKCRNNIMLNHRETCFYIENGRQVSILNLLRNS